MRRNTLVAELCAEFLGTFTILIFGLGVVAQVVAGNGLPGQQGAGGAPGSFFGNFTTINFGWGFGVALAVYVAGGISGAHLNPAVTLALALRRGFSWGKVGPYWAAQLLGAFVAALLIRWNFHEFIRLADPNTSYATQGIFSTSPGEGLSVLGALRSEIIGTAILVMLIFAISDERNTAPLSNLAPFIVGIAVLAIGLSLGATSGYAINPARDFGPRVAEYLTGYGTAFRSANGSHPLYWWVPIVGPLIGGAIGAYLYDGLIGRWLPIGGTQPVGEEPPIERPSVSESEAADPRRAQGRIRRDA